ncbi:hypothetical protein O181_102411 [Austropuccinia psidii MF-1]|uniref:Uncharacterized protein n=1 Tax=Austropuccinia psidii MF-1 TaxID=1389203 RepID=A0A9Q3JIQ5_9BASI|nr:hypothetical protein [Austropuccinia psidii MF-1]
MLVLWFESQADNEEGEESEEIKVAASFEGAHEAFEAPNVGPSNQPLVSQNDAADDSSYGTTHSSSFPKGHFKSPRIEDSIN